MGNKDLSLYQSGLSYNLIIIKALWKSVWGNYGENGIKGNEYDFSSLYRSIEKGKETIRLYIQGEYSYKEASIYKWANRIEAKTGIPHEYLTGEQRIVLGKQYETKHYPLYNDYLHKRESISDQIEDAAEKYSNSEKAPKDETEHFNYGTTEEIKQFVKENYSPEEQKEFHKGIKDVSAVATIFAWFNSCLAKETDRITKMDTADLMYQNEKLCKLVYFIRFKKKYDGISIRTIDDIKLAMQRTRTFQLKQLGKKGLEEYIEILEEHLNLARSVYTVAIDCGDFVPNKHKKKQ